VSVDLQTLLRHEPQWKRDLVIRGVVGFAGVLLLQPILVLAGLVLLVPLARRYAKVVDLMKTGETMPAKLVSISPTLVAAFGDLSRGPSGSYPVLVVFEVSVNSLQLPIQRGDRIPVVARGIGGDHERFSGVEMRLISTVNEKPEVHQRALEAIPEWDWESLDEALFDLSPTPEAGVYALN
jgi:hypothetical protein